MGGLGFRQLLPEDTVATIVKEESAPLSQHSHDASNQELPSSSCSELQLSAPMRSKPLSPCSSNTRGLFEYLEYDM